MAKRKAPSRPTRKAVARKAPRKSATRKAARTRPVKAAKKTAGPRKKAVKAPRKAAKKAVRKTVARKPAARKAAARKAVARKQAAPARKKVAAARKAVAPARKPAPKPAPKAAAPRTAPRAARKVPALDRARRTVTEDDALPSAPSSLGFEPRASAAVSGHEGLERREDAVADRDVTAGDVDANWESAYSVGDEAPGGDNPTPDQDVVDEIGHAMGMEYEDDEELGGEDKLAGRDSDRWELDPESSEDFDERD